MVLRQKGAIMIIKNKEMPTSLKKLQALYKRTPFTHHKYKLIKENLAKQSAGYKGELSLAYPLSLLSDKKYYIFHDIRLLAGIHNFQVDALLLSRKFIVILEVKNITGTLYFDQYFHQLIRTQEDKEEAFPDPLTQINRHTFLMKKWLKAQGFPDIPIESFVVISSPYTLIKTSPENQLISRKILRSDYIPSKFIQLDLHYKTDALSQKELEKLSGILLKNDNPGTIDILKQYGVARGELIKGVECPLCKRMPMDRTHGNWQCPACGLKKPDLHLSALKDYSLLISSSITSREAREFLLIDSKPLATRLLRHFSSSGSNKGKIYHLHDMKTH
ncbi:nuclease-related domain-containing protein [Bacillus infantis]|uniref:nuclease-related domain-containing protein n=1 Tax=Bacillus infantis TaxID=324767 RepID=UPI002155678F|nr:nuclease-related domain-containing protein [Bacillus infantis]MCR6609016.1 NERD domain-containing protein [Bacillus infantis]